MSNIARELGYFKQLEQAAKTEEQTDHMLQLITKVFGQFRQVQRDKIIECERELNHNKQLLAELEGELQNLQADHDNIRGYVTRITGAQNAAK